MAGTSEPAATVFRYESKELTRRKDFQLLCRTDLLIGAVQTVGEGGETNLHMHRSLDGFWFVLRGQASFYTTDDELVATLGHFEGILVPRGYPYWFESTGDENLEILQVEASAKRGTAEGLVDDRVDLAPPHEDIESQRAEYAALLNSSGEVPK